MTDDLRTKLLLMGFSLKKLTENHNLYYIEALNLKTCDTFINIYTLYLKGKYLGTHSAEDLEKKTNTTTPKGGLNA